MMDGASPPGMALIGVLGGMSWESTQLYYRLMNEAARERLGGLHSARVLVHSVDFAPVERMQHAGDWPGTARMLGEAARGLAAGGAGFLVIATNTMHRVADEIAEASGLDVLHIADPTGEALRAAGHERIGLLGTRFTMEGAFYRDRLIERHGLDVIVPEDDGRAEIHRVIYEELCLGDVRDESRAAYVREIEALRNRGATAVILGCTEITMLIAPHQSPLPTFDTTALHAEAAVARAIDMAGR